VSRFLQLLKRRSHVLHKQLGELWYLTEPGSAVFTPIRVLIQTEADAQQPIGMLNVGTQSKVIQVYKDPRTVVGGVEMGGLLLPKPRTHRFVTEEDKGNPHASDWVLEEVVKDDLLTWTLRCERKRLQSTGK
jgi:hypothetical protein